VEAGALWIFRPAERKAGRLTGVLRRVDARVRRIPMMDVILVALAVVLFALTVGYAYACERL
jgi:hypothetical protein